MLLGFPAFFASSVDGGATAAVGAAAGIATAAAVGTDGTGSIAVAAGIATALAAGGSTVATQGTAAGVGAASAGGASSSWVVMVNANLTTNTFASGVTSRQVFPVGTFAHSGTLVRLTLAASTTEPYQSTAVWIGHGAAGATPDFHADGDQVQVTVASSTSFTIPTNSTVVTDPISFVPDISRTFVVSSYCSGNTSNDGIRVASGGGTDGNTRTHYFKSAVNEAHITDVTGYTQQINQLLLVQKIEFFYGA